MLQSIETESKKSKNLKKWLILTSRILALGFLILAFAKPFIPLTQNKGTNLVTAIFIDNSMSMMAEGNEGVLIEQAKNIARTIVNESNSSMSFQILNNNPQILNNRPLSSEDAIQIIDELDISSESPDYQLLSNQINKLQVDNNFDNVSVFLVSDFQKQNYDEKILWDSSWSIYCISLEPENKNNLSIDSAWVSEPISKPGVPMELMVKVKNYGNQSVESVSINAEVNGMQQGSESFSLAGKESKDIVFNITPPKDIPTIGSFKINDFPIVFDNTFYFSIPKQDQLNILCIGEEPSNYFSRIFQSDENFDYQWVKYGQVDYQSLKNYNLIIIDGLSAIESGAASQYLDYAKSGGVLYVIPSSEGSNYDLFLNSIGFPALNNTYSPSLSFNPQDLASDFFKNVYKKIPDNVNLPKVNKVYGPVKSNVGFRDILTLKDGQVILAKKRMERGSIFISTLPMNPEWSNFMEKELFVIHILKIAFTSNVIDNIAYTLNQKNPILIEKSIPSNTEILKLSDGKTGHIIQISRAGGKQQFWLDEEIKNAGIYRLLNNDSPEQEFGQIALNYSRDESIMEFFSDKQIIELFATDNLEFSKENLSQVISKTTRNIFGKQLWHIFILLALIFLLIEVLLLRFL